MSTARSVFTEAIEDHLALKKQNTGLEAVMPLARYDVGDPLERYPGGPGRAAEGTVVVTEDAAAAEAAAAAAAATPVEQGAAETTHVIAGPSPEQAMESATALEPSFADRPFEPLTGMTPMLSLVEDIEEEDDANVSSSAAADADPTGDLLRFPGGVGPREQAPAAFEQEPVDEPQLAVEAHAVSFDAEAVAVAEPHHATTAMATAAVVESDAPTGEQPVLVIDTDEPLASDDWNEPVEPRRSPGRKPRFFGLGRRKSSDDAAEGWFTDGPRDFNWD